MSDARDALSDLLKHPGWTIYVEHCLSEWGNRGTRYDAEMDKALDIVDPQASRAQALQIRVARKIVESLLAWPAQEVSRLGRVEEPVTSGPQRGGYR